MDVVRIRAISTLKLSTATGASLTYSYPKGCSVDEIARDALFAVFSNKGADGLREFVEGSIKMFEGVKQ